MHILNKHKNIPAQSPKEQNKQKKKPRLKEYQPIDISARFRGLHHVQA